MIRNDILNQLTPAHHSSSGRFRYVSVFPDQGEHVAGFGVRSPYLEANRVTLDHDISEEAGDRAALEEQLL